MENVKNILVVDEANVWTGEQKQSLKETKAELKKEAKDLRDLKHARKNTQRGTHQGKPVWESEVENAKWDWRHKHLAYCIVRGRSYEEIERKCDEGNEPDWNLVDKYKREILNG